MGKGWEYSDLGSELSCVGVFEVALHPEFVKRKLEDEDKNSSENMPKHYYLAKDSRFVNLKGLLVWTKSENETKRQYSLSLWMIILYAVLLLALILAQLNWNRTARQLVRMLKLLNLR